MLSRIRRAITVAGIHGALAAGRRLPAPAIRTATNWMSVAAAHSPLARRLQTNIDLALGSGHCTSETIRRYFRRFGIASADALLIHGRGLAASGVCQRCTFGESVHHLDAAVARGRGVVIISPHLFGYEIAAGVINTRHKLVGLARAGKGSKAAIKNRWYEALGMETVIRPRGPLSFFSAWSCLEVVRDGHCLGITPDLIDLRHGVDVELFGRRVHLMPGAFAVALLTRAPVVSVYGFWKGDYPVLEFSEPRELQPSRTARGNKDFRSRLQAPMQDWCREFEAYVRSYPENWMFWLDKGWTQLLRAPVGQTFLPAHGPTKRKESA